MYLRLETACAAALLVAIVVLVGIASLARTAGSPIIWSIEIAQLMFVWLVMLAADIALQQRRHFGLSLLLDKLAPPARKVADIVNILIMMALLAFLFVYAWRNLVLMHTSLIGATQMPASFVHGSMVLGIILLLRTLAVQLYRRITDRDEAACSS